MAKTGRRIRQESPAVNPEESPEESPEGATLFKEFRDDDYVRLQRRDDMEKTMVYHGRLAPAEATSDKVAELFGGGFYRAQHFQRDERGSYVITGTRTFKVPGEYKPPKELPGVGGGRNPAAPPSSVGAQKPEVGTFSSAGGSAMEAMNTALVSSVIDMMTKLREPQPRQPQGPQVDWSLIINGALGLMTTILSRKSDAIDPLVLLKEIKEIVGSPATAQPASNAIADAVKGLRELMHLKDAVDGKEPPLDAEGMMFASIPKLIEAIAQNKSAPAPASGTAPPQIAANPADPLWRQLLLSQRVNLLKGAQMGLDPEFAAEMALRLMPLHAQGVLHEFLAIPDHVELAMQTIPELRQFPHWITNFFAEVVAQLTGEEEEITDGGKSTTEGSGASS